MGAPHKGFTEFDDNPPVVPGAGPPTEQANVIAAAEPRCAEKLNTSLTLLSAFDQSGDGCRHVETLLSHALVSFKRTSLHGQVDCGRVHCGTRDCCDRDGISSGCRAASASSSPACRLHDGPDKENRADQIDDRASSPRWNQAHSSSEECKTRHWQP